MKTLLERLVGEHIMFMYTSVDEGKSEVRYWNGKLIGIFGDLLAIENPEKEWRKYMRFVTFDLTTINIHSVEANINPLGDGDHDQAGSPLVS